ncbi:MarR family transcriptional regulator [Nocardioides ginsengisoli]|uniref:MarR family winged helix-turn-helix transcriptional regulator n=1 Tax=Nocardioides ginsengisoli TaxID=363868 RepID=A0ABW3VYC5_9ACTN
MPERLLTEDDGVAAWAALLRTHAAVVPKLAHALTEVDLPLSWYDVLLVLNSAPDRRLRMIDLGAQAVLSREQISRVVTELERAGYVERQPNPEDKRSSYAAITSAGRARLRKAAPTYLGAIEEHFAQHLTDDEIGVLSGLLWRVVRAEERPQPRSKRST